MGVKEEACLITEETIPKIINVYDVPQEALEHRIGDYFVGEIGCDYWYSLLSKQTFDRRYSIVSGSFLESHMQRVVKQ